MSGALVNNYSQVDSNILEVQLTLDATRVGFHQVSLTNYDSTSESQIAAGSIIEVGGALYKFTANETITGSPSDGTVYIMIVPSGTTCTAQYTNTAPTWSDSKNGWYGTGGSAGYRYLEFSVDLDSTNWYNKHEFTNLFIKQKILYVSINAGLNQGNVTHYIPNASTNSRIVSVEITSGTSGGGVYTLISYGGSAESFINAISWNDTTMTFQRAGTADSRIFRALVKYI